MRSSRCPVEPGWDWQGWPFADGPFSLQPMETGRVQWASLEHRRNHVKVNRAKNVCGLGKRGFHNIVLLFKVGTVGGESPDVLLLFLVTSWKIKCSKEEIQPTG